MSYDSVNQCRRMQPISRRTAIHFPCLIISRDATLSHHPPHLCLQGARAFRACGDTGLETVLEAAGDILEVSHAASTDGLSSLGLLAPVVCSATVSIMFQFVTNQPTVLQSFVITVSKSLSGESRLGERTLAGLSSGVAAGSAGVLLDVQRAATCNSSSNVSPSVAGSSKTFSPPRSGNRY